MVSKMFRLLLVTLLAFVLVDSGAACRTARSRIVNKDDKVILTWNCPPDHVLFEEGAKYQCFEKSADCPNGIYHENECHCFPGTSRDSAGVCGKICKDCENGWCSSVSKCECNDGFNLSQGRCVNPSEPDPSWELPLKFSNELTTPYGPDPPSCQTDYIWDPKNRACIPYESADAPKINARMDD